MTRRDGQADSGGTAYTRAMLRRMLRTRTAIVPARCAERTPAQVITAWCKECGLDVGADAVAGLSSRLHQGGVFYFADDGALIGSVIVEILTAISDAIREQSDLIAGDQWPKRNRLRMLAERFRRELDAVLGEQGMA